MKTESYVSGIYALLVFLGGMIGYFTSHSLPSLIMGTAFSILMFICAYGIFKSCMYSLYGAMVLSTLLMFFFSYRFLLTTRFFPGGVMSLLSALVLVILFKSLKNRKASTP